MMRQSMSRSERNCPLNQMIQINYLIFFSKYSERSAILTQILKKKAERTCPFGIDFEREIQFFILFHIFIFQLLFSFFLHFLVIVYLMAGNPKANFNDRLRRLGCDQLHIQLKSRHKSKSIIDDSSSNIPFESHPDEKLSVMLTQMRRQIQILTHRQQEVHEERNQWQLELHQIAARLRQKEKQTVQLSQQLAESRRVSESLKQRLQDAQSQLQNLRLREKMEAISKEISKSQPTTPSPFKHQKHKKGQFSSAALPSAFGSLKKFEFRNSQLLRGASMADLADNHSILSSPFSGYLIEQWQRSKEGLNCKQLQVTNLQSKLEALKKQITKQKKEIQTLKSNKPANNQLVAALEEYRQQTRRNKIIFMKLRESEKKRKEMAALLKEKGETTAQQDKFNGYSTLADINEMVQKTAQNIQIESAVIEVTVQPKLRLHKQAQTQSLFSSNLKISSLQMLIQQLTSQLVGKEQQFNKKYQQMKEHYELQIEEYMEELQEYRIQIEENGLLIAKYQKQNQSMCDPTRSIAVDCKILDQGHTSKQTVIDQAAILMQNHQNLSQKLKIAQSQNGRLKSELYEWKRYPKDTYDNWSQIDESLAFDQEQREETARLNRIIASITEQREHFRHCYEQALTSSNKVEAELQSEASKLRLQNEEKQQFLRLINAQMEQKSAQVQRYRRQLLQMQIKLHNLDDARQKWEHYLKQASSKM